jgi:hypothetical protein
MRRLVSALTVALVILAVYTFQRSGQPDPRLISLAVRATVFALPTPAPQIVEVTRVVEVTRIVEVTRRIEVTATPALSASVTPVPPSPTSLSAVPATPELLARAAALALDPAEAAPMPAETVPTEPTPTVAAAPTVTIVPTAAARAGCPATSGNQYTAIPVGGPRIDHPDAQHGDLNLALRGYVPTDAGLGLADISGPTDGDPPQLAGLFDDGRLPAFTRAYHVRDWNWGCGSSGCRGDELHHVEVSLLGLAATPGEAIRIPTRGAEIYGGGYTALVLYADPDRLTLGYTREDTVANGYAVHLEALCVDPNLVALYRASNEAGRGSLPGLHNGDIVGSAHYNQILVAVRDRGAFADPRSRKDWWRGY